MSKDDTMETPLMDRLHRPRSVFTPGHRIRMNIVPMFLNIFVPWGVFITVLGIMSFWMMYDKPGLGYFLLALIFMFWVISVLVASERKRNDPEPSWYRYFSIMLGLAFFCGLYFGREIFASNSLPYYMVKDLKVIGHMDASKERGQNVMDAGVFYFAQGNKIDAQRSWHFKQGTVYCVAPVISGNHPAVPETQSFDFWAVGKDCCSESSSDFRCGAFNNPLARSAVRVLDERDRPFYRLAVEQAETLYGIMATHPVFFEWSQDPLETVNSWKERAFTRYLLHVTSAFLVSLLGVACASCKFAWLGRSETVYGMDIVSDSRYKAGGPAAGRNFRTGHEV